MWDTLVCSAEQVFGGDAPTEPLELGQIAARCVAVYIGGLIIVRLGKSRLISRTSALDVILGFILGSILSRGITGSASISGTLLATAVLVGMHWLFTLMACRWHWFGSLIKGNRHLLVEDGVLQPESLRRSHISKADLMEELRLNGCVNELEAVQLAYKERSGEVSVVKRKPQPEVIDVGIESGVKTVRIEISTN